MRWGACEVLALQKGWAEKALGIHAEGVAQKVCSSIYAVASRYSHIEGWGAQKVLPCLERGWGVKSFGPVIFPLFSPPSL